MKKREGRSCSLWKLTAAAVLLLSLLLVVSAACADLASEARGMLKLINELRTGSDAWYWNPDNQTYTVASGLRTLEYDTALEEVALVRAKEIAISFSHTRPDGSQWYTA